jgi:mono/diheme cytochrome c family protein
MREVVGLAVAVWLMAIGSAAAQGRDDLVARGRAIAEMNCARCHAVGREGDSPLKAAPEFRTLARKYPIETLAEPLSEGIVTGHRDMPIFVFSTEDVDAFLAYLESINAK